MQKTVDKPSAYETVKVETPKLPEPEPAPVLSPEKVSAPPENVSAAPSAT
jgi:hypothetical protein